MALIIDQQPQEFSPAYNQQPWVLRETDYTDADFSNWRVTVNVYRSTLSGQLLASMQVRFRYGTGGRIVFDPMRIVESEFSFDHGVRPYTLTPWALAENSFAEYYIVFASQYFDGTKWLLKSLQGGGRFSFNGVFSDIDYVNYTDDDYFINTQALTNAPTSQDIGSNDSLWLHTMTDVSTKPTDIRVRTYNYTGGLLNTYTYTNPFADWTGPIIIGSTIIPSDIAKRRRVRVAVGTRDLALMNSPVSFIGAGSYTVEFRDDAGNVLGSTYTLTINDCSKYTPTRLHWLNRLGGFDAFTFKLKSKRKRTINRSSFERQKNTLSAGRYAYTSQSRGDVVYNTDIDWSLHVVSDPLTDAQTTWLKELAESPVVFMENTNGTYTAMTLRNKDYMIQRSQQDGIHYAEFDLDYALNDRVQRG